MKEKTHVSLQQNIDNIQRHSDNLQIVLCDLCDVLGEIVGYKYKAKKVTRIHVNNNGKDYDVDDLVEQAKEYVGKE